MEFGLFLVNIQFEIFVTSHGLAENRCTDTVFNFFLYFEVQEVKYAL